MISTAFRSLLNFAAARAAALGLQQVAEHLHDRFDQLAVGRRTALPKHQRLLAVLDWSYGLLTAPERATLRRISVFVGGFSLASMAAVVANDCLTPARAIECLDSLAAKSLVMVESQVETARFWLLETTRAYARRMLQEAERTPLARRHALYCIDLLRQGDPLRGRDVTDDVSAALDWAFSARGDHKLGITLTLAAIPLWSRTSMVRECHRRVQQAIARLDVGNDPETLRNELELLIALATAMQNGVGPGEENARLWQRAHELAMTLRDADFQLRTLWGLWINCRNSGEHRQALEVAQRFGALAASRGASGAAAWERRTATDLATLRRTAEMGRQKSQSG